MTGEVPESAAAAPKASNDAFISYASQNKDVADAVCEGLEHAGVACWIAPRNVSAGEFYADAIVRALNEARILVLVLTAEAVTSPHVLREVERTSSKRHAIVTVRLTNTSLPPALEYFLSASHWLDATASGVDGVMPALVAAVKRLVEPTSANPAKPAAVLFPLPPGAKQSQRLGRLVIALSAAIAVVVAYLVVDKLRLAKLAATEGSATVAATRAASRAPAILDNSVAVLPFSDMSDRKDQEYFSDGLSEELINLLTQVPGLRVPARTSSFSFKGKQTTVSEIAKTLSVSHVLEGSVRKSGNRLRIVAELIDARTDAHLWSQTYDRELTDVFAIQDEIAAAVVARLRITLLGAAPKARTTDPKAYALFLEGLQYGRQFTKEGFERSIALFQQALAVDPNYAGAWDGLAMNYINQSTNNLRSSKEGSRLAREAANKAIAIDPEFASGYARLGSIAGRFDADFPAAARFFEHALALQPSNSTIVGNAAGLAFLMGRLDTAIVLQKYTNGRDPLSGIGHQNLAIFYIHAGRPDEALAELHAALSLNPKRFGAYAWISRALLLKDEPKAALAAIQKEPEEDARLAGLAMAHYALGNKAESDVALGDLIKQGEDDFVAGVLAFRGESDRAFEWLQKAASKNELGNNSMATDPDFDILHRDPRWLPFLRKLGVAPEQLAAIKFEVKLPE